MGNKFKLLTILCAFTFFNQIKGQSIIPLYKGAIPGAQDSINAQVAAGKNMENLMPTIQVFIPEKSQGNRTGVLIIPGGGYGFVNLRDEGSAIAEHFTDKGITAFVLKYRLPGDGTMKDKKNGPIQDAQTALQIIRQNAAKWNIDADKIGVIGFSAGGHLASTLGTHFNKSFIENKSNISLRPDFMILVYPVISMKEGLTHQGSKLSLLGKSPSQNDINYFSSEEQVTNDTPPTYLTHTGDDGLVPVENSIVFYEALLKHHVPAEMLLLPKGNHGFIFGLKPNEYMDPIFSWMKQGGWITN